MDAILKITISRAIRAHCSKPGRLFRNNRLT